VSEPDSLSAAGSPAVLSTERRTPCDLLLPVLVSIGCMLGVMTLYLLFEMATGQLEEG